MNVEVGVSGTGGGFERFCAGETDISNASRPIDEEEEVPLCAGGRHRVHRVPGRRRRADRRRQHRERLGYLPDGRPAQDDLGAGGRGQGRRTGTRSTRASPTRRSRSPARAPTPGRSTTSPTRSTARRAQAAPTTRASEDDNVIVQAVAGDPGALGYFGYTYYEENQDTLKAVEVDGGEGCVAPSVDTARDGSYAPLSRPLFIYVKNESLAKPEVLRLRRVLPDELDPARRGRALHPGPRRRRSQTNLSTLEASGT